MDKGIFKDTMIGEYIFDLSAIYLRENHLMEHQWVAFNNPNSEQYSQIQAYVKLSIQVTAQGDDAFQISEDTRIKEDTNVLMSPSLNPQFFEINIRVLQG